MTIPNIDCMSFAASHSGSPMGRDEQDQDAKNSTFKSVDNSISPLPVVYVATSHPIIHPFTPLEAFNQTTRHTQHIQGSSALIT